MARAPLAVPVAIFSEMVGWRESAEPDALAAILYVAAAVGLVAVGALAGWRGVLVFVPVFVLAAIVEETWVYEEPAPYSCDPLCSSPIGGVVLVLPLALLLIGLGIWGRIFRRDRDPGVHR